MKIALFTDTFYDANGVSRFLQDIAFLSYKNGIDLTVITSTCKNFGDQNLSNVINIPPLFIVKMPFYNDLDLTFVMPSKLSNIFKKIDPDIVHVSTPGYIGLIGRNLAKKYKKPLVGTYHTNFPAYLQKNTDSKLAYDITLKFMKMFYKPFSLIFSRSKEYKFHLQNQVLYPLAELKILPFGIDLETFFPNYDFDPIYKQIPILKDIDIKILYVGRLTKEKNFHFLINIWKKFYQKMREEGKNALLICIGEGSFKKDSKKLEKYNMLFLGKKSKNELAPYYTLADFFVFPSTTDTLGQVVLESLACKTTLIVSDKGGPKNIIKNNNNPCGLIKKIDENLWIEAMIDLSNNVQKREMYALNGYKKMQNHSIENSFNEFIKAHKLLLQ